MTLDSSHIAHPQQAQSFCATDNCDWWFFLDGPIIPRAQLTSFHRKKSTLSKHRNVVSSCWWYWRPAFKIYCSFYIARAATLCSSRSDGEVCRVLSSSTIWWFIYPVVKQAHSRMLRNFKTWAKAQDRCLNFAAPRDATAGQLQQHVESLDIIRKKYKGYVDEVGKTRFSVLVRKECMKGALKHCRIPEAQLVKNKEKAKVRLLHYLRLFLTSYF